MDDLAAAAAVVAMSIDDNADGDEAPGATCVVSGTVDSLSVDHDTSEVGAQQDGEQPPQPARRAPLHECINGQDASSFFGTKL